MDSRKITIKIINNKSKRKGTMHISFPCSLSNCLCSFSFLPLNTRRIITLVLEFMLVVQHLLSSLQYLPSIHSTRTIAMHKFSFQHTQKSRFTDTGRHMLFSWSTTEPQDIPARYPGHGRKTDTKSPLSQEEEENIY